MPSTVRAAGLRASKWVFPDSAGSPQRASNFYRRHFFNDMTKAKVPVIRFHDMRHTFATIALASSVPVKVVSEILGHAHIVVTLSVYGHVLPGMHDAAIETIDAAIG